MAQCLSHTRDLYNLSIFLNAVAEDWQDMERFFYEVMHRPSFRKMRRRWIIHPTMTPFWAGTGPVPTDPESLARLTSFLYPWEELQLIKIEYGSPGFSDFTGAG